MANVLDLSVLPAKVTIKNISKDVVSSYDEITSDASIIKHEDGSTKPGAQDMQETIRETLIPASVSELQVFGKNLFANLEPEDSVVLKVETSKELLYWNLLKEKHADLFKVTIEKYKE